MTRCDQYPAGVPCFVDTLTADPAAAMRFYAGIFGWEFAGPRPMPGDPLGRYFVARVQGDDVAGVGSAPAVQAPPGGWNTTSPSTASRSPSSGLGPAADASCWRRPMRRPRAGWRW